MIPEAGRDGAPRWIGREELFAALSVAEAANSLEVALRAPGELPVAPQRSITPVGSGQLLSMPAGGSMGAGAKLVTVQPNNPGRGLPLVHGVFLLFSAEELRPVAVLDGAALTELRTPAVSVVAARALARSDANHLVLFGAGTQARAHALALQAEFPLERVTLIDPTPQGEALVAELRDAGLEARHGEADAVATASIVCCCTTAAEPLFDGAALAAGAHISAMGSYQAHTREIDEKTLRRGTVVVEDREAVLAEAGDLRIPVDAGRYPAEAIAGDIRDAARGHVTRRDGEQVTVFKSVGVAWEDLVVACEAWSRLADSQRQ